MKPEKPTFNAQTETGPQHTESLDLENAELEAIRNEAAQNVVPYLTLDKLNEHEILDLSVLARKCVDAVKQGEFSSNVFDGVEKIANIVAELTGEADKGNLITPKLGQARKLFCANLLNALQNEDDASKWQIYEAFFGMSPSFASYCGGLSGTLELLTISERTPANLCTDALYSEAIYDYSFTEQNDFKKILEQSSPVRQLRLLPIYNNVALKCDLGIYNNVVPTKVGEALTSLKNSENTTPLVKLAAESVDTNISDWFGAEWISIDANDPEYAELLERKEARRMEVQQEQEALHAQFPNLPNDQTLTIVAPGIAATFISDGTISVLSDQKGQMASLLDYSKENPFGINQETAALIGAAHNSDTKNLIEEKTKIKLERVPLDAQIQFLKFMTTADNKRFDRLCSALSGINENLRLKLAENFVAADFGAGFGDSLLEIAESRQLNDAEKQRIFDTISSCRESIGKITELYAGFDGGEFQGQFARATNERLTDAITVFSEIAKSGSAEADLGSKGRSKFDFAMAIEALEFERKSLEIIGGTLEDVSSGHKGAFAEVVLHPDASSDQLRLMRTMYNFYSPQHGYVLLYTRPEGSHSFDNDVEYGKSHGASNIGVEASISFIVDPTAKEPPFKLLSPFKPNPRSVMDFEKFGNPENKVSAIRLDREGRAPGRPANALERDPINEKGMISVDLAAINDGEDTPSGKIARLISVGNKLRGDILGKDSTLNHNTNWFDQAKYGTGAGFKKLVEYVDEAVAEWCRERSPDSEVEESFTYLYREAGRKATRAA